MRKMNHFKLLAVICAMTLFASCNFEEINTNQFEMSDGEVRWMVLKSEG